MPLLRSRFAYRDPALFLARASLDDHHLHLTGWSWHGRYRRRINLDRILHVDVRGEDTLILWLFDGETLRLRMPRARRWKHALEA